MKSIFSRMAAVALTLSLGFAAGSANAVPTITTFGGNAASGYTAVFGNNDVGNTFSDWINFSVPADTAGSGGGVVTSNFTFSSLFNVSISAFGLYEGTPSVLSPPGILNPILSSGSIFGPLALLTYSGAAVPGNYWLNVAGNKLSSASGGYSGTITTNSVAAIPEPETYAMMLAGLGLLGFSARRRNKNI